jgi:hypothetical protein
MLDLQTCGNAIMPHFLKISKIQAAKIGALTIQKGNSPPLPGIPACKQHKADYQATTLFDL